MHSSNGDGCHKVEPTRGSSGNVDTNGDVSGQVPDMGVYLLARLRMWIVCSWLPADEATS